MAAAAPKKKLDGRVAIVTGASRGIGREIALTLARNGARVVIGYEKSTDKAREVASMIEQELGPGNATIFQLQVDNEEQVKALFDCAESSFGRGIHILVNSAGISPLPVPLQESSVEIWDRTMSVNARGSFLCCREAARRVVRGGGGRIINISSILGNMPTPGYIPYSASKAASDILVKTLARELSGEKITVNAFAPGPVDTDMMAVHMSDPKAVEGMIAGTPLKRVGTTSDVAAMVLFAASDEGEWLNGQCVMLAGGLV